MDTSEALRSIRYDLVEYIQKKVYVNFDNAKQMPVSFIFDGTVHVVDQVLVCFRMQAGQPMNAFLMQVNQDEVYLLYFHYYSFNHQQSLQEGNWILCLRILSDHEIMALYREERKMLLNMHLKRIVDFHGHLCPDLVIGYKLCEYAQKLFLQVEKINAGISVIAENCTSSLDAIQIMLGTTVGNQHLQIIDFGKHNYTLFSKKAGVGFRLSFKKQCFGDEKDYRKLERLIVDNLAVIEDVLQYQKLLDGRIKYLLGLGPEDIFSVKHVDPVPQSFETANIIVQCCICGEQVLNNRKIEYKGEMYCIPCFRQITKSCAYLTVH